MPGKPSHLRVNDLPLITVFRLHVKKENKIAPALIELESIKALFNVALRLLYLSHQLKLIRLFLNQLHLVFHLI